MRILAIDTSGPAASAAVYEDRLLAQAYVENRQTHSEKIMLLVDDVLRYSDTAMSQIDGVAVAAGPGSFKVLRIGLACTKAIAQARNLPCLGVNTLDVLCLQAQGAPVRCAIMDARRGEVYGAAYQEQRCIVQPCAMKLTDFLQPIRALGQRACFAGDGIRVHEQMIRDTLGAQAVLLDEARRLQRAASVAAIAAHTPLARWQQADTLEPLYLRIPQAEREAQKR